MNIRRKNKGLDPRLRAALIMFVVTILLQLLGAFIFIDVHPLILYFFRLILFIANGYLAGMFYYRTFIRFPIGKWNDEVVQYGAGAGLLLGILAFLTNVILIFVLGVGQLEDAWANAFGWSVGIVVCGPLDVLMALCLGALGGQIAKRKH